MLESAQTLLEEFLLPICLRVTTGRLKFPFPLLEGSVSALLCPPRGLDKVTSFAWMTMALLELPPYLIPFTGDLPLIVAAPRFLPPIVEVTLSTVPWDSPTFTFKFSVLLLMAY